MYHVLSCLLLTLWLSTLAFHTNAQSCNVPQNLFTDSVTSSSAVLEWDTVSTAVVYRVIGNAVGASVGSFNELTSETTFTFTGLNAGITYWWSVRAICDSVGSNVSALAVNDTFTTIIPVCATPGNLALDTVTTSSAGLTWDDVTGAVGYQVIGNSLGADSGEINVFVLDNAYQLTNLNPDISYWWTVRAICDPSGSFVSAYADEDTFSTNALICPIPQNISASNVGEYGATLSWDSVPGAIGYQVGGQNLSASVSVQVLIPGGATTSLTVSGLEPNETYIWRVRTWCDADELPSPYTENDTFTTAYDCFPVYNLEANNITDTSVVVSWDTFPGSFASSYTVYGNPVGTGNVVSISVPGGQTELNAADLTPNTTYQWAVLANCMTPAPIESDLSVIDTFSTTGQAAKEVYYESTSRQSNKASIYPNPMSEIGILDLSSLQVQPDQIRLRDVNGRLIRVIQSKGMLQHRLDIQGLTPGFYFVELAGTSGDVLKLIVR